MGEWGWVFVGYAAMIGALAGYTWWLRIRLRRTSRRIESSRMP